jgi:hypothetical protein
MMMFDGSEGIIWPMWMVLSLSRGWGLNKKSATFAQLPSRNPHQHKPFP